MEEKQKLLQEREEIKEEFKRFKARKEEREKAFENMSFGTY